MSYGTLTWLIGSGMRNCSGKEFRLRDKTGSSNAIGKPVVVDRLEGRGSCAVKRSIPPDPAYLLRTIDGKSHVLYAVGLRYVFVPTNYDEANGQFLVRLVHG